MIQPWLLDTVQNCNFHAQIELKLRELFGDRFRNLNIFNYNNDNADFLNRIGRFACGGEGIEDLVSNGDINGTRIMQYIALGGKAPHRICQDNICEYINQSEGIAALCMVDGATGVNGPDSLSEYFAQTFPTVLLNLVSKSKNALSGLISEEQSGFLAQDLQEIISTAANSTGEILRNTLNITRNTPLPMAIACGCMVITFPIDNKIGYIIAEFGNHSEFGCIYLNKEGYNLTNAGGFARFTPRAKVSALGDRNKHLTLMGNDNNVAVRLTHGTLKDGETRNVRMVDDGVLKNVDGRIYFAAPGDDFAALSCSISNFK